MKAIFKREFASQFETYLGYLFIAILLLCFGAIYTIDTCFLSYGDTNIILKDLVPFVAVLLPLLSMKTFTEEKHNKTDKLLYSLPLSMTSVTLGKFLAVMATFSIPALLLWIFPVVSSLCGGASVESGWLGTLMFMLLCSGIVSVSMFVSAHTEHLLISVIVTYVILASFYFLPSFLPTSISDFLLFSHFGHMTDGYWNWTAILYYLGFDFVCLFLTIVHMEKSRWM